MYDEAYFTELMNQKTDSELINLIKLRNEYQPLAAKAILKVALQRNIITQQQFENYERVETEFQNIQVFENEEEESDFLTEKAEIIRKYNKQKNLYSIISMGIFGLLSTVIFGGVGFIIALVGGLVGRLIFSLTNSYPFPDDSH